MQESVSASRCDTGHMLLTWDQIVPHKLFSRYGLSQGNSHGNQELVGCRQNQNVSTAHGQLCCNPFVFKQLLVTWRPPFA